MSEMLNAGCILCDRYEIRDLIVCDGKEVHYLVEDLDPPHEQLTLKEFIPQSEKEIEGNELFWKRLATLSEVRHPNLIKIYEYFTEIPEGKSEKRHYVVMEYIKGRTLQDIFQTDLHEEPLPIKVLMKHMIKVCGAMKYLNTQHTEPVAFGVLKPKYIMLTPDRQIKLFNYGLGNLLRTGYCSKTPGFSPIEQIGKGVMNEKTDVYSLSATMYYLLTGRNPEKYPGAFSQVSHYNKEASPELNEFIARCLSPRQEDRPGLQEVSNFLLQFSMGKRPKSVFAISPGKSPQAKATPTPDKVDKFVTNIKEKLSKKSFSFSKTPQGHGPSTQEEVKIDTLSDFSAHIAEPSEAPPEAKPVDIFTLSDEKSVSPGLEKPVFYDEESYDDTGLKGKFHSAPKRGTRRFDVKQYMAAAEALKLKKVEDTDTSSSPELVAQKAKESREKSAELFAKLTSKLPPVKPSPSAPGKPSEEKKKEIEEKPSEEKKKETEEKPSEEKKSGASLAQKLAQKYARKKQDEKEQETQSVESLLPPPAKKGPPLKGIAADWREQKQSICQNKPDTPPLLSPLQEGTSIKERYEIAEILHKDYSGAVYMVLDTSEQDNTEGQEVSKIIKEIQYKPPKENARLGERVISNFVKLGGKLKNLNHPNLVKVTDYFFNYSGDRSIIRLFIVMEQVEGYTLEEIIKSHLEKQSRMPSTTVFAILTKVCEAIYYLHSQKPPIVAGDLNPKNILISYNGEVKFINYGLREIFLVEQELVFPMYGTIGYFAPEQTEVDITNTKADVFALGSTIYYLLTGVNPEKQPYEFSPVRKLNPYISGNVEAIVDLCVKINPAERGDIKTIRERMNKITMVELDSSLLEKQKEMQDKRKASMEEIGNITPLSVELGKLFLKYGLIATIIVCVLTGGYFGYTYYKNIPAKGKKIYISMSSEKILSVLDINKNRINQKINLSFDSNLVSGALKKKQLFVTDKGSMVYILDTTSNKSSGKFLSKFDSGIRITFMALSPDETKLYLLSNSNNKFKVIDLTTRSTIAEKDIPVNSSGATLSTDGKYFYIINSNEKNSLLTTIETDTFTIKSEIPIKEGACDITAGAQKVFIIYNNTDEIGIIDIGTGKEDIKKISTGSEKFSPVKIIITANNQELYLLNQTTQEIAFIQISDMALKERFKLPGYPVDLVINPGGYIYIYLTELGSQGKRYYSIAVFDRNNKKIFAKIPLQNYADKITLGEH
ncbi:MAG: protein kinase [Candidatus Eremiobacterota bacterium]